MYMIRKKIGGIEVSKQRQMIWDKSGGVCWYCGEGLQSAWHTDHFLPLGRNPDRTISNPENDNFDNLVPACPGCNIMKSDMDIDDFRQLIGIFTKRLNRDISIYRHARKYGLVRETDEEVVFWFENNKDKQMDIRS